ncbi:MAG TPA: endolytic transglycosylase MltG, partial [Candidatus Krumholzibacteria bacterium]|nr:endolytic transglycosylase MltG [Candidatus Krumholzibacteria bacterium]
MKAAIRALALVVVLGVVAGLGFCAWVAKDVQSRGDSTGARVRMRVEPGASFVSVLRELEARGLVKRAWTLRLYARATGQDRRIQHGTYEFVAGTPPIDLLHALAQGDVLAFAITIPEGFNLWQVSGAFDSVGIDSTALLSAVTDADTAHALQVPAPTLEGYLFPDTYRVPFGSTVRDVVSQMTARAHAAWTDAHERRARAMGLSRHEVLTLASIVEAEARVADERPTIAAVYHNRLRKGMRLEADPTVAYAMGGFRGRLYYKDLAIDSPYNTYRRTGLPPGPICNPGELSIHAALYPAEGVDVLYFVARGDG